LTGISDIHSIAVADKAQQILCRKVCKGKIGQTLSIDKYRPETIDMQYVVILPLISPYQRQQSIANMTLQALRGIATLTGCHTSADNLEQVRCNVESTNEYSSTSKNTDLNKHREGIRNLAIANYVYQVESPLEDNEAGIPVYLKLLSFPSERSRSLYFPAGTPTKQLYIWLIASLISEAHDCTITCEASYLSPHGSGRALACLNGIIDNLRDTVSPFVIRLTATHIAWQYDEHHQMSIDSIRYTGSPWFGVSHFRDHVWLMEHQSAHYSVQKALLHLKATLHSETLCDHSCPTVIGYMQPALINEWCTL